MHQDPSQNMTMIANLPAISASSLSQVERTLAERDQARFRELTLLMQEEVRSFLSDARPLDTKRTFATVLERFAQARLEATALVLRHADLAKLLEAQKSAIEALFTSCLTAPKLTVQTREIAVAYLSDVKVSYAFIASLASVFGGFLGHFQKVSQQIPLEFWERFLPKRAEPDLQAFTLDALAEYIESSEDQNASHLYYVLDLATTNLSQWKALLESVMSFVTSLPRDLGQLSSNKRFVIPNDPGSISLIMGLGIKYGGLSWLVGLQKIALESFKTANTVQLSASKNSETPEGIGIGLTVVLDAQTASPIEEEEVFWRTCGKTLPEDVVNSFLLHFRSVSIESEIIH